MRIDIVRNKYDIIHLDKLAGQFVLDNFGIESECVWGIWLDREIIGYCTLGFAEGVLKNANYTDYLLSDVFIVPKYRNKGYATLFLQEVLSQVYAPIYAQLLDKELINFYSRFDFVSITDYLIYRPN